MKQPKVALVHDYLNQYGGAEKTLEAVMDLYPNAPIYTGIYKPEKVTDKINSREIKTSRDGKHLLLGKAPKHFTFLMPLVFENFDLREFDLVISLGTAWAKSVLTSPSQLHISYIHTPPRFLYNYSVESQKRNKWYFKPFVIYIENWLRTWDYEAAQRPDFYIANSKEIQRRVQKFYNRESQVIYPPVELEYAQIKSQKDNLRGGFYCALGRLSAYKNFDLLVEAFNLLGMKLVIMGSGVEEKNLKKFANENIEFLGFVNEETKHKVLDQCLGFINPVKDEDFGIVPLEAMSHGKPVLAHKSGGHLETIQDGVTGMFFDEVNLDSFVAAMKNFDEAVKKGKFDSQKIMESTKKFSIERFKTEFKQTVDEKWIEHLNTLHARTS